MNSIRVDNSFGKQRKWCGFVNVDLTLKDLIKSFMTGRVSRSDSKSRPLSKTFHFSFRFKKNDWIQNNTATLVAVAVMRATLESRIIFLRQCHQLRPWSQLLPAVLNKK